MEKLITKPGMFLSNFTGVDLSLLPTCIPEVEYQESKLQSSDLISGRHYHVFLNRMDMAATQNMKKRNSSGPRMIFYHKCCRSTREGS